MEKRSYLTPQRKLVYEAVSDRADHPTAADVIERLRQQGHKLAYATIYNSLRYLTDAGLIQELKIGDTLTRYDACTEAHHHTICRRCGRVDEVFASLPPDYFQTVAQETGYHLDDIQLVFRGLCPDCARKTPEQ